jgi:hypothetical protein
MSKRVAALITGTGLFLSVLTGLAGPAQAAPAVKIDLIYFDSPGSDTGSNTSLNAEYLRLRNTTGTARTITGWTVRDASGHVYKLSTTTVKANSTLLLRSGTGTDNATTRYWQQKWYVWNNSGDKAELRNSAGTLVHSCSYGSSTAASTTCP